MMCSTKGEKEGQTGRSERERERETETETETERDRERDRERDGRHSRLAPSLSLQ